MGSSASKNTLGWKWVSSQTVKLSDFGSPTTTTDYVLCVYDGSGLKTTARVQADRMCGTKPCWKAVSTKGFKYTDKSGTPNGLTVIKLMAGAPGKIGVKGKGANLPLPTLPLTTPVRVQLKRADTGGCWDATYSNAIKNTSTQFKAGPD
jgi:hypothetical protein